MVDVGAKPETAREAVASAAVRMTPATLALVARGTGARGKGDVLATARLAAVMALQAHRRAGSRSAIRCASSAPTSRSRSIARCPGVRVRSPCAPSTAPGVEMEAMVGAAAAALTIYDMVKGVERGVEIRRRASGREARRQERRMAPPRANGAVKPNPRSASNRKG